MSWSYQVLEDRWTAIAKRYYPLTINDSSWVLHFHFDVRYTNFMPDHPNPGRSMAWIEHVMYLNIFMRDRNTAEDRKAYAIETINNYIRRRVPVGWL